MSYRMFRRLKKLGLQKRINWTAREGDVTVPLEGEFGGELLGELAGRSWKSEFFRRLRALHGEAPFVDAGANLGQTLARYAAAGPFAAPYLAFEPNPFAAAYVAKLAQANRWRNVEVFPFALGAREQRQVLELAREDDAGASVVHREGRKLLARHAVACMSLDFLRKEGLIALPRGFFLKIDVEGAEVEVMRGARRTIGELQPIIQCEVLWAHAQEAVEPLRERNAQLAALLRELGYRMLRLRLDVDVGRFLGVEEMSGFPSGVYVKGGNSHQCEYLFLPRELPADWLTSASAAPGSSPPARR